MKAFVICLNGKRLYTAGIGPNGVLSAIVHWVGGGSDHSVKGEFGFHVGGRDSRTGEHTFYKTPKLKVGDRVCVKIVEANRVDSESKRFTPDFSDCETKSTPKGAGRRRKLQKRRVPKSEAGSKKK